MTDIMRNALQNGQLLVDGQEPVSEPEPVDWEKAYSDLSMMLADWQEAHHYALMDAEAKDKEIEELKKRCAELEENVAKKIVAVTVSSDEPIARIRFEDNGNLVTCNDCGKLLYRLAKDLHNCESQSVMSQEEFDKMLGIKAPRI